MPKLSFENENENDFHENEPERMKERKKEREREEKERERDRLPKCPRSFSCVALVLLKSLICRVNELCFL